MAERTVTGGAAGDGTGGGRSAAAPARAPRRAGRPARIDRATIARAAGEIGIDRVSMRSVAERLGVSVPGLYHYVQGREDLLRLAAEQSAARISLPVDRGQHWAEWLFEWADLIRRAFVASPALLAQFMQGTFGLDRMVDAVDSALGLLIRQGFEPRAAFDAYIVVTHCAMGAAVTEIRERETAAAGTPASVDYYRVVGQRDQAELPHLRALLAEGPPTYPSPQEQLTTVLAGIAARRGESWPDIVALLRARETTTQPTG
ncbi:MAG: TetR/AcrR family transcriptional regulator C-terminal domain-containing protein [Frankia sp.]|nr:TetR/AcrR family transcriptional regulator C-terminal domain-containing protein [Frankia sp.]